MKRSVHELARELVEEAGVNASAVRKRIYRLRNAGATDIEIIERLKVQISHARQNNTGDGDEEC
jgi:hypothetical protein